MLRGCRGLDPATPCKKVWSSTVRLQLCGVARTDGRSRQVLPLQPGVPAGRAQLQKFVMCTRLGLFVVGVL